MPRWRPELRSLVAILCLTAILVAAWHPASSGLFAAILVPLAIFIGFVSSTRDRRRTSNPRPQLLPFLSILPARAPPVLL